MTSQTERENLAEKASVGIYRAGGLLFGDFTLASGKKSPYYIDLRPILSWRDATNEQRKQLVRDIVDGYVFLLEHRVSLNNLDIVLSIPKASQMYAGGLSFATGIPVGYVEDPKGHGVQTYVEGTLRNGDRIVILDDLITTAGSIIRGLGNVEKQAQQDGLNVTSEDVVVLVDRMQGGVKKLAEHRSSISPNGVRSNALFTTIEMLEMLYRNGLDHDKYQSARDYTLRNLTQS